MKVTALTKALLRHYRGIKRRQPQSIAHLRIMVLIRIVRHDLQYTRHAGKHMTYAINLTEDKFNAYH